MPGNQAAHHIKTDQVPLYLSIRRPSQIRRKRSVKKGFLLSWPMAGDRL
jgi:hypothetical protein